MSEVEFSLQVKADADVLLSWGGHRVRMKNLQGIQQSYSRPPAAVGPTVGRLPPGVLSQAVCEVDHVLDAVADPLAARLPRVALEALV